MKKIFLILFLLLIAASGYSQNYEPSIVILKPDKTVISPELEEEASQVLERDMKVNEARMALPENAGDNFAEGEENLAFIHQKIVSFDLSGSFSYRITSIATEYLLYRFYEAFPNLMIFPVNESSAGRPKHLLAIAREAEVRYVLNFPYVRSYSYKGQMRTDITVQLYDSQSEQVLLDQVYVGEVRNPGFYFACDVDTLSLRCTINDAMNRALEDIVMVVAANNPSIIREREVFQKRMEVLMNDYYQQLPPAKIPAIVKDVMNPVPEEEYFHGLLNQTEDKFIGFYIGKKKDYSLSSQSGNNNATIVMGEPSDIEGLPNLYGYIIAGVKKDGRWYISSKTKTYFSADSPEEGKRNYFNMILQQNGFFKEESSEPTAEFWKTNYFAKVKGLTLEPDYEKYRMMYEMDARENKPYIGMYEIVANQLKKEEKQKLNEIEARIGDEVLGPWLDSSSRFRNYNTLNKSFAFIFNEDNNFALVPLKIISDEDTNELYYFLVNTQSEEIYLWNYFEPLELGDSWHYGSQVVEQLGTLTKWNFSFATLNDQDFWSKYVFKKVKGDYKYLQKLK